MIKKILVKNRGLIAFALCILIVLNSCTSAKQLAYFQDLPNTSTVKLPPISAEERIIEVGDDIYVNIFAKDNQAAAYFNKAVSAMPATGTETALSTPGSAGSNYIVDPKGYLEFPIIGKIKVTGLTAIQLQDNLKTSVSPYLKDPIVDVRFNTFRISVLGAVNSPGIHTLPIQRTTLFEALASAGDLPLAAQRYDIQLYRDYNGQRKIMRLDLRRADILNNPELFQMRNNDVLYVKPRASSVSRQEFGFITSILGLVIGLVTLGIAISNHN